MHLDGVATPLHEPVFGVAHTLSTNASLEEVLDQSALSCLTVTALDSGSTREGIESASSVSFDVSTKSGVVTLSGSVQQVASAFGGTHYSVAFITT